MAGHSKWSNIKHKKKINDIKKSKLFSKIANTITTSLKHGADINNNCQLKNAISKAMTKNINKNIINKLVKKHTIKNKIDFIYLLFKHKTILFLIECENNINYISDLKYLFNQYFYTYLNTNEISLYFSKYYKIEIYYHYNEIYLINTIKYYHITTLLNNIILFINIININKFINLFIFKTKTTFFFNSINKYKLINKDVKKFILIKNKLLNKQYIKNIFYNIFD